MSTKRTSSRHRLVIDPATSARLSHIRQANTKAEVEVRRILHRLGLRFRVLNRDLAGSPDIANRLKRWVVFVHGCFWHRHQRCSRSTTPKRNRAFWEKKFAENVARDRRNVTALKRAGWIVVVVWECELAKNPATLVRKLRPIKSVESEPRKVE